MLRTAISGYLCTGEYRIGVKYNDEHVPKSPKMVQVDPQCEAAKKVTIHGLRDRGLEVRHSVNQLCSSAVALFAR